jgi:serine/threonine protein kinase
MEMIEGLDLKRLIRERGPLPPAEACRVAIQVADGLHAVHRVGIVHRDLKPQNVMLDRQGDARLMDFGLAKSWRADGTDGRPGYVVGTPEYMSPEQARGEPVDLRSDIYALGIVCHEIFTGAVPLRGSTPATTLLLQIQQPPPLDDDRLPPGLVGVLRRSLAKQVQDRYASALEMGDALREMRATLRGRPMPASVAEVTRETPTPDLSTRSLRMIARPPRRRRFSTLALAAGLTGALAFWALESRRTSAPPPVPMASATASLSPAPQASAPGPIVREAGRVVAVHAPRAEPSNLGPAPSPPAEPLLLPSSEPAPLLTVDASPEPPARAAPKEPGQLQVGVRPWAKVVVDGLSLGTTPLKPITLSPGEHTARLLHPSYPPLTRTVQIRPGEITQLIVDLRVGGLEKN